MGGDDSKRSKDKRTVRPGTQSPLRRKRQPASKTPRPGPPRTRRNDVDRALSSRTRNSGTQDNTELFQSAPIGYVHLTADGSIRAINRTGLRILGRQPAALMNLPFATFLSGTSVSSFEQFLKRSLDAEDPTIPVHCQVELNGQDKQPAILRLSGQRLKQSLLVVFEDVTEEKLREERRRYTEEAVREAGRRKDEFLAVLSHELRNPLAPIRNCLFVLSRVEAGSDQAKRAYAIIDRQVRHLTRLVDDLLDVTRIVRGKIQLRRQRLDLTELVRSTVEDHRSSFEQSSISLHTIIEEAALSINGDASRLVQAISNVLGNAEKFTPRGGTVTVSLQRAGRMALLKVRDTGVGVAPNLLQQLFEPFAQAPQTIDRTRGGLGLGLAMVKGLVEIHGGTVSIASPGIGLGTTVTLSMPIDVATADGFTERAASPVTGGRILIIEDSADAAEGLKEALELAGFDVDIAHDGPSGIEHARDLRPDVVLCDLGLPGMSGYEVARYFRADEHLRDVHLIALSGYALPEDIGHASAAGFNEHIAKPPVIEKLCQLLGYLATRQNASKPREQLHA